MTTQEAGHLGGLAIKAKYGDEFFSEIGAKGGCATRDTYGKDHYKELGRKGGSARKRKRVLEAPSK